jgi:hypothetical protein
MSDNLPLTPSGKREDWERGKAPISDLKCFLLVLRHPMKAIATLGEMAADRDMREMLQDGLDRAKKGRAELLSADIPPELRAHAADLIVRFDEYIASTDYALHATFKERLSGSWPKLIDKSDATGTPEADPAPVIEHPARAKQMTEEEWLADCRARHVTPICFGPLKAGESIEFHIDGMNDDGTLRLTETGRGDKSETNPTPEAGR